MGDGMHESSTNDQHMAVPNCNCRCQPHGTCIRTAWATQPYAHPEWNKQLVQWNLCLVFGDCFIEHLEQISMSSHCGP